MSKSVFASRRQFIGVCAAAMGAAWVGTGVQSLLFPERGAEEARPVTFPLSELPVGGSREIAYGGKPAIVLRTAESIKCYSMVCTHLGCNIEWQAGKNEFHCPCHDGRFDRFGEVISGPPPVPLEQYSVKVTGDQVVVG